MGRNWQVGSVVGIPVYLNVSWLLVVVSLANAEELHHLALAGDRYWTNEWAGLFLVPMLFGSVVLHELGHNLAARAQGIGTLSITLFLFGGVAANEREPSSPLGAFKIAIAGPGVNLILGGLCWLVVMGVADRPLWTAVVSDLGQINLCLGLFNLLPGLPLDGGQMLKAWVWQISGDRFKGVRWAAAMGRALGVLAIVLSLVLSWRDRQPMFLWLGLIGLMMMRNASLYLKKASLEETLLMTSVGEAMGWELRVVDAYMDLRSFADKYLLSDRGVNLSYFAAAGGRYCGLVRGVDLHSIERSEWDSQTLKDIAHSLYEIPAVLESTPLFEAIMALDAQDDPRITVLTPAGAVAGTLDRSDIVRAIATKLDWKISAGELRQIREEGRYPPYLQPSLLAKSLKSHSLKSYLS